jgi:hypothetical protein
MRKIVPLLIVLLCVLIDVYAQAPQFHPHLAIVNTTEGFTAALEAPAFGAEPISYQWKREGTNIPGATSYVYRIEDVQMEDEGTYILVATNANGTATTTITLEVGENYPPSVILTSPGPSQTFTPGTEFSFSADGEDPNAWSTLRFVWTIEYHDNGTITPTDIAYLETPGENESAGYFYIPPDLEPSAGAFYRIRVTIKDHLDESDTEYRDVPWSGHLNNSPPEIEVHPQDLTVAANSPATLSVEARFASSYRWTFEGSDIPGATNATYHINNVQPQHAGTYQVFVSNAAGTTASNEAVLTVDATGTIVLKTNPANLFVVVHGEQTATRYTFTGSTGAKVNVGPHTPQTVNGVTYAFSNWSHGGAPNQGLVVSGATAHYTLNYSYPLIGPWRTTEVGAVNIQGSAAHTNGTYTLTASGNDIWNTSDAFRFVYQAFTGDVDIRARVTSLTNTHPWAKAGVMIRNSNDPKAKNVMTLISPGNGASFQRRVAAGGTTAATVTAASAPSWVRLVRSENTFTSYISSNGINWTAVGAPLTLTMNDRVYIGLALTSHSSNALATATFTNVSVTSPSALIASEENQTLDVYPNPVSGNTLQVKLNGSNGMRKLEIVNLFGRVVYQQTVGDVSDLDVDIQPLPQGIYQVRIFDEDHVQTRSLVRK